MNKEPIRVGLTGGIGSGKTTVAHLFENLGIPVYYADKRAAALQNEDPLREQIIDRFGPEVYEDGKLKRKVLAGKVFRDSAALADLNALVHPAVEQDFQLWLLQQNSAYIIKEAAIIFEIGAADRYDYVLVVTAPDELRIKRVMQRDQVTRENVIDRMKNQMPQQEKEQLADFVINNDGSSLLITQVLKIHNLLLDIDRHRERPDA